MANILDKAIRLKRKEFEIKTRLLYPKGIKTYILKRDGRTQKFLQLASFLAFGVFFDNYRHSETIEFAVLSTDRFKMDTTSRTMREIASIATHIAQVMPSGESVVYAIRTGDEFQPFYLDYSFKFFVVQVGDSYTPQ